MAVNTTSGAASRVERELGKGKLYAVLAYKGELASWLWAFFIPDPSVLPIGSCGTIFHVVEGSPNSWKFVREVKELLSSPLVVAILQLGDIGFLGEYDRLVAGEDLQSMFGMVAVPDSRSPKSSEFNSRTWFLDMVTVLHDCGMVTCEDVWSLEREIRRYAFTAMDRYLQNKGWTIFKTESCS
ncbi:hypothetical protein AX15_007124 [Amanita polypyramis BW_CC]|nr:hypothetical protein AX15_007124 [Amanita polypyramis BW_CC]